MTKEELIAWIEGFAVSGTGLSVWAQKILINQIREARKSPEYNTKTEERK